MLFKEACESLQACIPAKQCGDVIWVHAAQSEAMDFTGVQLLATAGNASGGSLGKTHEQTWYRPQFLVDQEGCLN